MTDLILRSINDFSLVPDDQIEACLDAFRAALIDAKRQHEVALSKGVVAPEWQFAFPFFHWQGNANGALASTSRNRSNGGAECHGRSVAYLYFKEASDVSDRSAAGVPT